MKIRVDPTLLSFRTPPTNGERASNVEIKNEIHGEWHHAIGHRRIEHGKDYARNHGDVVPPVEDEFNCVKQRP